MFRLLATLHRPLAWIIVLAVGVPPLLLLDLRVYVDVLGLLEGFEALAAELAADAAALLAAEGRGVVVREWVVDPDGPCSYFAHAPEHLLEVPRVDVRPEPVRYGVGLLYGLIQAVYPDYGDDGPEGFLAHHPHRRLDPDE